MDIYLAIKTTLKVSLKEEKDELDRKERGLEAATSKLRIKKEESLRKEIASNFSNKSALSKPSLRDLLNVLIPAYQPIQCHICPNCDI